MCRCGTSHGAAGSQLQQAHVLTGCLTLSPALPLPPASSSTTGPHSCTGEGSGQGRHARAGLLPPRTCGVSAHSSLAPFCQSRAWHYPPLFAHFTPHHAVASHAATSTPRAWWGPHLT